uniref:Uncharacterized protein n=1 Tax=Rhizophora mucronata TaxID=61149 RepID=A0A2P2Q764_RHIMU
MPGSNGSHHHQLTNMSLVYEVIFDSQTTFHYHPRKLGFYVCDIR